MAAGLGFKDFTTGEVLTAADVDGYLMQGIWVFASEAARNAAVTSPQEGNFAFTKDNNSLWYYDGAAWVASGATGDIEGVTAGTGISGGGTSGTVTITNSMATAIDAKGDLVVGTGADTFSRLAVGTNGHTLVADSSEATGLKWAAASSGSGFTKITSASFTSQTQVEAYDCFTSTYKTYYVIWTAIGSSNGADFQCRFLYGASSQQTSDYYGSYYHYDRSNALTTDGFSSTGACLLYPILNTTSTSFGEMIITQVGTGSSKNPIYFGKGYGQSSQSSTNYSGYNDVQRDYTGLSFLCNTGNITGTYAIYGLAN